MKGRALPAVCVTFLILAVLVTPVRGGGGGQELADLFAAWRAFESPPLREGAPDYTADTFRRRHREFLALERRLEAMDTAGWPVAQQVDWHLIRAEMNGYDFNERVLRPWERDPAFYRSIFMERSDVPAHEGPTHHAVVEFWTYDLPLSPDEERRLVRELAVIPPLMAQARENLTGNAKDLWIAGIRHIRRQRDSLDRIQAAVGEGAGPGLRKVIAEARKASGELVAWLEAQAPSKSGPSGIGRESYTWYQRNVHLVPMTWEDEVRLLQRELDRAWSSLKLEEHRNRRLPALSPAGSPEEYAAMAERSAGNLLEWLKEEEILAWKDYFEPALRAHLGEYVPPEKRSFFVTGAHHDPTPLYTHFYHWFELARMDREPHASPVRRGALLYNIFDSRNEGTATAVEEMFMHAGLYDDNPRVREIVWIMLAQRAARGLGSLHAHANEMTMEEAGKVHVERTPRGWMRAQGDLLFFEQHLYLRQPGYGTSYITGKLLLERTLADVAMQKERRGEPFRLRDFFDQLGGLGCIPISLVRWQMTGLDDEIRGMGFRGGGRASP